MASGDEIWSLAGCQTRIAGRQKKISQAKVVERGNVIAAITEFEVSADVQRALSRRILRLCTASPKSAFPLIYS